jgi:hypothetical protein
MGNLKSLTRVLKPYNVAVAKAVAEKRKRRGYDHFKNRRSTRPKVEPMQEPSILPLVKEE